MKASERRALNEKKKLENKPEVSKEAPAIVVGVDPRHTVNNETNNETPAKVSKDGTKRGTNPNSKKNLKPIKPGEVRNPEGRPEGALNWNTTIEVNLKILAQKYVKEINRKNPKKQIKIEDVDIESDIFQQYLNKARNGNDKVLLHFMDKRYGKASQPIEVEYKKKVKEFEDSIDDEEAKWFIGGDDEED